MLALKRKFVTDDTSTSLLYLNLEISSIYGYLYWTIYQNKIINFVENQFSVQFSFFLTFRFLAERWIGEYIDFTTIGFLLGFYCACVVLQ